MAFAFDLNAETDEHEYHVFCGNLAETLPRMLVNGFEPMSVAQMMGRRLKTDKFHWDAFTYTTGDAVIYHPDGRMKIVRDAKPLREVSEESNFEFDWPHRLVLNDGVYESLDGLDLTPREQRGVVIRPFLSFDPKRVRSNIIWQYLSRNQDLLDEFIDRRIITRKQEWYYGRSMQIDFSPSTIIDIGTPQVSVMNVNLLGEVRKPLLEAIEFHEIRDGDNACLGDSTGFWRDNAMLLGLRQKVALAKSA
jgi:hypothetical protein